MEIWKTIVGYESYSISSLGNLRNNKTQRIVNPVIQRYACYCLYEKNKPPFRTTGHRLVATHFIDNPKNLPFVCHKDDNRLNNTVGNLFWATPKENSADMVKKNRSASGERCGASKLTDNDVLKIRDLKGKYPSRKVGRMFGIVKSNVLFIWSNKTWKHI